MSFTRSFILWLITFLAYPLGGLLAVEVVGSVEGPLTALLAGGLAGAVIGVAQWLALRPRGIPVRWVVHTFLGMAVGSCVATAITDAGTSVGALVLTGLISGAIVGAAQGVIFDRLSSTAIWAASTSIAWGLGWLVTANVIVDADRGYVTFGSSGALLATALTGLVLHRVLPPAQRVPASPPAAASKPVEGENP